MIIPKSFLKALKFFIWKKTFDFNFLYFSSFHWKVFFVHFSKIFFLSSKWQLKQSFSFTDNHHNILFPLFVGNIGQISIFPVGCILNNLNSTIRQLAEKEKRQNESSLSSLPLIKLHCLHSIFSSCNIAVTLSFMVKVISRVGIFHFIIKVKRHAWFMVFVVLFFSSWL
mgnify:CR=1 FL=1